MPFSRIALLLASLSPLLAIYRGWRAADAQWKGLLSDVDAQRELLTNAIFAGVVYLALVFFCIVHLRRNDRMGFGRKFSWMLGFLLLPIFSVPTYVLLHVGLGRK